MNAYDIAKDLDREGKFPGHVCYGTSPLLVRAANVLRKQADRIAELEKFNKAILKKGGYPHKPLSDEEILNLYKETGADNGGIREFVRAIEERHGIK